MASELFWFFDALALGILLVAMYFGGRRGLMKSVVTVVLIVAVIVVSWFGAEIASPIIYDNLLKDKIVAGLDNTTESADPAQTTHDAINDADLGVEIPDSEITRLLGIDGDFFANLTTELKKNGASDDAEKIQTEMKESVTEKMLTTLLDGLAAPETVADILETLQGTTDSINGVLDVFISGDKSATAQVFEETVLGPAIKGILRVLIFVLLLIVLKLITNPIAGLFKFVNEIPIIGPVNKLFGGVLGIVEGAVIVIIVALLVRLTVFLSEGSLMFLNIDTIDKTYLFKYFYYMDWTRFGRF